MTYSERLRMYEAEKKRLWMECSSTAEYEQKIREIARKWKV